MARVKTGTIQKNKRKKILKQAKGYRGAKSRTFTSAKEQVMRSDMYAYRDRKQNKRNFRKLWITRINAACRLNDISYSKFMHGLKLANIELNRKMLSEIAIEDPKHFTELVNIAKEKLGEPKTETKKVKETPVKKEAEVKEETNAKKKTEVKAEPKVEEKTTKTKDLNSYTVAELRDMARDQGKTGYSTLRKAELIELLEE